MKEAESLEYGGLAAKDYIPGAEILRETAEVDEQHQEQGEEFRCLSRQMLSSRDAAIIGQ